MPHFEKVSKFSSVEFPMPMRKTENSAGYDLVAAQDSIIPSYFKSLDTFMACVSSSGQPFSLQELGNLTKETSFRPTLVSTGVKCQLAPNTYLEVSARSSSPLKYWLILANGVGIIDADYYNNPSNEGEIFLQLINLSPCDILIKKGEAIGQGIIKHYLITDDDSACGARSGGFGSTSK